MASGTAIGELHVQFKQVLARLDQAGEVNLRTTMENHFRKIILVSAASHFESALIRSVVHEFENATTPDHPLVHFMRKTGIERRYHTWFAWGGNNANQFFALFGEAFRTHARKRVREREDLVEAAKAFMEVGRDRNQLVHEGFATIPYEKTMDEVYALVEKAKVFVEWFPGELRDYIMVRSADGPSG